MRTLSILILLLIFQNCNSNEFPLEIKKTYLLNKEKNFSAFENWNIYLREGKNNVYLFDYTLNDKIEARYLIIDKDSIIFKRVFPLQDSVFFLLKTDSLHKHSGKSSLSMDLYLNFKSLEVDAMFYRQKEKLFLLKKDKITLVRTMKPIDSISNEIQFVNYKKIDPYWFYHKDE